MDYANEETICSDDTRFIKEYSLDTYPIFLYISTPLIPNYWYLKVNFLAQTEP